MQTAHEVEERKTSRLGNPLSLGFLGGVAFGLLILLIGPLKALMVLGTGLLGLSIGAAVTLVQNAELDIHGAIRTLVGNRARDLERR